jgi:hypothetical protein
MTKRFRLRFTFWLDMQKADEAALAETVEILKQNRSFVATIRDGIRLICDLKAGQTEVLFELFPWVREAIQPAAATTEQRLQEQISRLETLLLSQGNVLIRSSNDAPARVHSAPSNQPGVEIVQGGGKASAEIVAKNFIASMGKGFFD